MALPQLIEKPNGLTLSRSGVTLHDTLMNRHENRPFPSSVVAQQAIILGLFPLAAHFLGE